MDKTVPPFQKKKIVVGLSGGVDSAVSAYLLKKQGHEVIGLFMKNWEDKSGSTDECPAAQDYQDVIKICEKIDIPYYAVEFVEEYWENVFSYFLKEYKAGNTPNPDVLCNREIKFNVFFEKAMDLGADFLATGHYAQIDSLQNKKILKMGLDANKDQSYFLYMLKSNILEKVIFPIGHLDKKEVRKIAEEAGLPVFNKKDSTGICFIGKRDFRDFLSQYLKPKKGSFITLSGETVGTHEGAHFYTIGQRKGLGLGGQGERWFVLDKDVEKNTVTVERGDHHPALYSQSLIAHEMTWIHDFPLTLPLHCEAKIRYRQKNQKCTLLSLEPDFSSTGSEGKYQVIFNNPQRAIAPGQSIVFYQNDLCLGGGIILNPKSFPLKNSFIKIHEKSTEVCI